MAGFGSMLLRGLSGALLVVSAAILVGCGTSGGSQGGGTLRGSELDQARRLYAQLQREHSLQRDRKTLDLAASLLDYYPGFARNDEVLTIAVEASARSNDPQRAVSLTHELLGRYPDSPLVDAALQRGAQLAAAIGDTATAADLAVRHHDRNPARGLRSDGTPRSAVFLTTLSSPQLQTLLDAHPRSDLRPYLRYLLVTRHLEAGLYPQADEEISRLQADAPDNRWTGAALEAGGGTRTEPGRRHLVGGPVRTEQVGILCPLTGRYAVLGNAFYEAASLALQAANAELGREFTLQVEDTAGDPVTAALAARRLCGELGSMAVLGPLMSDPTATVALVADAWGVPLVSPTATNDRIWELGEGIFQTNLTGFYEVKLLAQLAARVMLKKEFGLLYPDDPEGRRHADVFRTELEQLGAEIVAEAAFAPQGTDFRAAILSIRERRPEIIFVPASVDQMVLLGPQLDFYHAGSLVMGLSNWNSQKLAEHSDTVLDRAIFPDDFPLFPPRWSAEFEASWNQETYPREATALALKTYQATRMLLDTLALSGATNRAQLTEALDRRLANQDFEAEGPASFGSTVRMFLGKRIVPFPAGIYAESWRLSEGVAAEALAAAAEDSVPLSVPPSD